MNFFSNLFHINRYVILARVVIVLLILPLHEFAHGWVARKFGDDTAEAAGRLTVNPIAHLDPFGSVLLLFTGFGWAKPVPINPARMRNPRQGVIWTSLAGPLSNLLAALVGIILLQVEVPFLNQHLDNVVLYGIYYFLQGFVSINISLAVFNLIPIPPLDGSNILLGFLPYKAIYWVQQHRQVISFVFLILIFSDFLDTPLSYLQQLIFKGFTFLTNWVPLMVSGLTG